ncbi:hypothetical protein SG34_002665 [Thalassomonas viridans]|uniref:Uncharacterized protein n=1 Tax=Thalassomonas viridans TaxID=137584 RepID=A0AAE9Z308_9GAMM|nr:hypothetical protein [Thalassomonas viridans]WDE05856.1 hypothetical protein SG34_002665 [Thalassomonas viridans]
MQNRLFEIKIWFLVCVSVAGIFVLDSSFGTPLFTTKVVYKTDLSSTLTYDCESWEQAYAREQQLRLNDENMFVEREPMFILNKWFNCKTF